MKSTELKKYQKILDVRGLEYGGFNHAKAHYEFLKETFNTSYSLKIADLGCGVGKFPLWIKDNFPQHIVIGIEPVFLPNSSDYPQVSWINGDSTNIPLEHVDILTSFDVMEHIHPDEIEKSLKEIARVTDHYICKICTKPSKSKGVDGEDLHPTVKPLIWWEDQLLRYFDHVKVVDGCLLWAVNNPKTKSN